MERTLCAVVLEYMCQSCSDNIYSVFKASRNDVRLCRHLVSQKVTTSDQGSCGLKSECDESVFKVAVQPKGKGLCWLSGLFSQSKVTSFLNNIPSKIKECLEVILKYFLNWFRRTQLLKLEFEEPLYIRTQCLLFSICCRRFVFFRLPRA